MCLRVYVCVCVCVCVLFAQVLIFKNRGRPAAPSRPVILIRHRRRHRQPRRPTHKSNVSE